MHNITLVILNMVLLSGLIVLKKNNCFTVSHFIKNILNGLLQNNDNFILLSLYFDSKNYTLTFSMFVIYNFFH